MLPPPHSVDGRAHASQSLSPRKERVPPLLASPGDLSMRGLQDCTWLAIVAVGPYIPAPTLLPATPPRPPGPSQCQLLPADSVFTPPSLGPSGHHRPLLCILRASGPAPPQLRHPSADRPHLLTLFLHPQCWPFLVPQQTPGMQRPHEAPSAVGPELRGLLSASPLVLEPHLALHPQDLSQPWEEVGWAEAPGAAGSAFLLGKAVPLSMSLKGAADFPPVTDLQAIMRTQSLLLPY